MIKNKIDSGSTETKYFILLYTNQNMSDLRLDLTLKSSTHM